MLTVVQKKAFKLLFVLLLFFTPLFAQTLPNTLSDKIEKQQLYNSKQWQRILHFKEGKSEIDDPKFFFSTEGKSNLKSELKATIQKLLNDSSDDENSTLCRYPSRSMWILEQLPELKKMIKIPQCHAMQQELKVLNAKQITLILASAHINSPASAFGHTFLRIDSDTTTPLLSYAVNYAAQTDEDNGFVYAYQGLFGGYKGRYSIEPYSKKLKEYSDLEQRDVWEYPLKLSQEEIDRMILHIFEIRHFYADYFFLEENCSYNLLWLIEVAKQNGGLTDKFNFKAIPIDTLRAVERAGLIQKTLYRPSKRKKILQTAKAIEDIPKAINFAKSLDYNSSHIEHLSKAQKADALELAIHLLQIRHSHNEIDKKTYLNHFIRVLKERSQLGKIEHAPIKRATPPKEGHPSSKITFTAHNSGKLSARAKIAYHDIYDNEAGYISGAYINFFDTAIDYKNNKLTLQEINILDIRSYALQDAIFKPISWQVSVGGKRVFNNEFNAYLQAGGGIALGNDKIFAYATLTPTLYYKESIKQSLSANLGLIYNPSSGVKFGILSKKEWFKEKEYLAIETIEPFITYNVTKESAIHLRYKKIEEKEQMMFSWFLYF